jgi:hypothetical protein
MFIVQDSLEFVKSLWVALGIPFELILIKPLQGYL